ncbi:MAG: hypothetical protein ACD_60C00006G0013 [uncultured bacterium]|nr:MAG: hypothetical protein ACD_60C00006G0013 [uncultured bacterium]
MMRKNILIITHNNATQFIDICNQYTGLFDKEKYKVTVAYLSGEPNDRDQAKTLSEEVIFLNCSKKSIRGTKIIAIKKLITLCRERKFSIVICHRYKPIYTMLWVAQFCHIPVVFFVMHAMNTLNNISRKILIATLYKKNMFFAGVSNAVREDMRKNIWRVPDKRVVTLYNCIDVASTEKALLPRIKARDFLKLPENVFVFGTTGRLVPGKDQKTLIQAFAQIKSPELQLKLIIIGDGELENNLKDLTKKLKVQNDVIFTGFIPDAFRYLKAFDAFILPSVEEAFGRVLLEAMIAKLPVVGTRVDGIPEVIQNKGVLVEKEQPEKLASIMTDIMNQTPEELAKWGDAIYQHVKENFSFETFNRVFWNIPFLKTF